MVWATGGIYEPLGWWHGSVVMLTTLGLSEGSSPLFGGPVLDVAFGGGLRYGFWRSFG